MGLSSDKWREDEILPFERTHISMFSAPRTDRGSRKYVGALVGSIKCQVVDKSLPVACQLLSGYYVLDNHAPEVKTALVVIVFQEDVSNFSQLNRQK
jgi:hypothetical protein